MAEGAIEQGAIPPDEPPPAPPRALRGWRRWLLALVLGVVGAVVLGIVVLNSPIGNRFVVERIARYAPASGLRVEIGRIDGSLMGRATLRNVTLSDPKGPFLRVPEVELDWRPLNWFTSGLDVRRLVLHRGTLLRVPKFNPGNPNAPLLPKFDIRIDRFEIDRLTVAKGVFGDTRRVSLVARTDIRKGRVFLSATGRLGGRDRLFVLVDSQPARDRFDISLDYNAPKNGLLATLAGAQQDLRARMGGKGDWKAWNGGLLVEQGGKQLAALRLTNRSGHYGIAGLVHPDGLLSGLPKRATGEVVAVTGGGTFKNSVLKGRLAAKGRGLAVEGTGTVDLGDNEFDQFKVRAQSRDKGLLGPGTELEGAELAAKLDGKFRDLQVEHRLSVARLASGTVRLENAVQQGIATYNGARWTLPVNLRVARIVTGNAAIDPRLVKATALGRVHIFRSKISSDNLTLAVPGLSASLALRGDMAKSAYGLGGPVVARGFAVPNLGLADANAKIALSFGKAPWMLDADVTGRMSRVDNPTLITLAGTGIRFSGHVGMGGNAPILLERGALNGSKLNLTLSGHRLPDGRTAVSGRGRHADYGPFTVQASLAKDGPSAELVFASPLPAAGLKDVHVALAPIPNGFRIETNGDSRLGPFAGTLGLFAAPGGPTRIDIEKMDVWKTSVTGSVLLDKAGVNGQVALDGGGVNGTIKLMPRDSGQGFDVALTAQDAHFGGANPLAIGDGRLEGTGLLKEGHTSFSGNLFGEGIQQGSLFIGRLAANGRVTDGRGRVTASLAGRRGSRFNLQMEGDFAPERFALIANGDFAGQTITMPRRAVLTSEAGGWRLAPTQVDFAGGRMIASGLFDDGTELHVAMADMPLTLADIAVADLGLGGKASGIVDYRRGQEGVPSGQARLMVKGLSRSGLVLTSRPVDVALVASLSAPALETRAVIREGGEVRGRLQGRISGLPTSGTLVDRLNAGSLFAQLRFSGPADALWRLLALEAFDLTGPVDIAADVTGTLHNPAIRGSLASTDLRLQSSLTGTDVSAITAHGNFSGSRLEIPSFSGKARNGGQVSGSGSIDLTNLGTKGPSLDFRLAARDAQLLARDDIAATVTGPMRIVSDGVNGTIAGRLKIMKARWRLGRATAVADLPDIKTTEINRRADIAPPRATRPPWRYLVDVHGDEQINVRGLGLDSEWRADLKIRGTTAAPTFLGQADVVRGAYEFAGTRFEMTKGRISFDGGSPPDPRLDIAAASNVNGLAAKVTVTGTATKPEIEFSSVPALPEEELLSRLLFGASITDISAPEALQLGAALASLRGGGGIDPINKLRTAIGLDRLRIVNADPTTGRETGIAAGKYLGRRFYVEIISDGHGYSATQVEFRVTSWVSILAGISTIGQESLNAKVSRDY
jgi:translocation and assembly module TamB